MPYIEEEGGRLNNFAVEPKIYQAKPPTKTEQRNYIILGVAGMLLVSGLIFVAFSLSNVS
ncbi:MAG: ssl1498 family light-harvesting-like protein [Xenococcaceae cyanobacterium]